MTTKYNIEGMKIFKKNLINFITSLIEVLPNEPDLCSARFFIEHTVPTQDILNIFIPKVFPLRQLIKRRDENFFLSDNNIFGDVDKCKVIHFKKIWMSHELNNDDRDIIWKWIDRLILAAERC